MSFGYNSGVVGSGVGQGFSQGTQQLNQNYMAGVDRQDRKKEQDRAAAQNALAIKVQQFRELQAPTPPENMTDAAQWEQFVNDYQTWGTTRQSLAGDIDSLMGVTVGDQKSPDGTPISMKTFSEVALGTNRANAAQKLAVGTQSAGKLTDLMKQLEAKQKQLASVVQAGGTSDNPEYTRLKSEADALEGQVKTIYQSVTGNAYTGSGLDYAALNASGEKQGRSQLTKQALSAYAENTVIAAILGNADGKNVTMDTKLTDVGFQLPGTVSDVYKAARGDVNLDQILASGDLKKALQIYVGMSSAERNNSKGAQSILTQLETEGDNPVKSAWSELGLGTQQYKLVAAQAVNATDQHKNNWQDRADKGDATLASDFGVYQAEQRALNVPDDQINASWQGLLASAEQARGAKTNAYQRGQVALQADVSSLISSYGDRALKGDPTVLASFGAFKQAMNNAGVVDDNKINVAWNAIVQKYDTRTARENADLTLAQQAVTTGQLDQAGKFGELINSGTLYVLDQAGMSGDVKAMIIKQKGEDAGATFFNQAVADSQAQFTLKNDDATTALLQRKAALQSAQNDNEWYNLTKADKLRALTAQSDEAVASAKFTTDTLRTRTAQVQYDYFAKGAADLGTAWLNSPNVQQMAQELNVDLSGFQKSAEFTDWARSDKQRSSALDEFYKLVQNPRIALSADQGHLRELTTTLGLNYEALRGNLQAMANESQQLTQAQLNQLVTNTWATREGVKLDWERFNYTKTVDQWEQEFKERGFQWSQYTWRTDRADNIKYRNADLNLRTMQFEHGLQQDDFSNAMQIINNVRQDRQFALQMSAQDRSTMAMYAGTLKDSTAVAQGAANEYGSRIKELEAQPQVKQQAANVKLVDGEYKWVGPAPASPQIQEYVQVKNAQKNAQATVDSGISEMQQLKQMMGFGQGQGATSQEKKLYGDIFGEGSYPAGNGNLSGGNTASLSPAYLNMVKALPGKSGQLVRAAVDSLNGGLVEGGVNIGALDDRCSSTLRILAQRVGVNSSRYFGGTAKETYMLTSQNGMKINSGGQLLPGRNAASMLQVGDLLYQDFKDNNTDHIAMYIGNGLVYEHNSSTSGTTGAGGGNIHVVPLEKFLKIAPVYGARIPELQSGSTTPVAGGTTANTPSPVDVLKIKGSPTNINGVDFIIPDLTPKTFRANVSRVGNNDLLAVPTGKGMYNLVTDTREAMRIATSVSLQLAKAVNGYMTQSPAQRREAVKRTMQQMGYVGNLDRLVLLTIKGSK